MEKEFSLTLIEDKPHPLYNNIFIKKIEMKNHQKNVSRTVTHYHINNWVDKTAPKESAGLKFLVQKLI